MNDKSRINSIDLRIHLVHEDGGKPRCVAGPGGRGSITPSGVTCPDCARHYEEDRAHGIERLDNGMDRLPCGCLTGLSGTTFVMQPCALDCKYYLYTVEESRRTGSPVHTLDAREEA